jgi:predicted negative regulator of RcsB-dependent stress response
MKKIFLITLVLALTFTLAFSWFQVAGSGSVAQAGNAYSNISLNSSPSECCIAILFPPPLPGTDAGWNS